MPSLNESVIVPSDGCSLAAELRQRHEKSELLSNLVSPSTIRRELKRNKPAYAVIESNFKNVGRAIFNRENTQ